MTLKYTRKQIMNKSVIQYQTQVLTNKKSPTEMNRLLLKIETSHTQTTQSKH